MSKQVVMFGDYVCAKCGEEKRDRHRVVTDSELVPKEICYDECTE